MMKNFERMNSLMGTEPIDEQAVGMLLNHVSIETGSSWIEYQLSIISDCIVV